MPHEDIPEERHKIPDERHQCWFCPHKNPSYLEMCQKCLGATIPTREEVLPAPGQDRVMLNWTICSFGETDFFGQIVPVDERRLLSAFQLCFDDFNTRDHVAIRLGNEHAHYILVRHLGGRKLYSTQISTENPTGEFPRMKRGRTMYMKWDEASKEQQDALFCFVDRNLED